MSNYPPQKNYKATLTYIFIVIFFRYFMGVVTNFGLELTDISSLNKALLKQASKAFQTNI
ncbi:MAG: hypothetical protein D0531_10520 [Methylococcales bacterium]|nr:MAG: hypothetical protein D0531_10520 [Methylococcales bacterium]